MINRLIISIDGGGIRGIIPLVILRYIQQQLHYNLPTRSHSWYGTSTGALIAGGLLIQREVPFSIAIQNVLDIYEFRSDSAANPLGASNPARALHTIIDENFGEMLFNDIPQLNVVACQLPEFVTTCFNELNNIPVADAMKASCAVPGIFPSVEINGIHYIDGFVRAKNPTAVALSNESSYNNLVLLSLGTGILREVDETEIQVKETHKNTQQLAQQYGFSYFRLNPTLEEASDSMQDTRLTNIFALKRDTENYIVRKKDTIAELISALNKI